MTPTLQGGGAETTPTAHWAKHGMAVRPDGPPAHTTHNARE